MGISEANRTAVQRMMEARSLLRTVATARDVIPGMRDGLLLHAGPPIEWDRMSGPLRGAVIGALLFEGQAANEAEAVALGDLDGDGAPEILAGGNDKAFVARRDGDLPTARWSVQELGACGVNGEVAAKAMREIMALADATG